MATRNKTNTYKVNKNLTMTVKNHNALRDFIKTKLDAAAEIRDIQVQKYEVIDKAIAGYLVLDEDDAKREDDNKKGYGVKPTDTVIPLIFAQLDEAVTYFLEVLSADSGLYSALAPKDKKAIADGFASLMNQHGTKFKHLTHMNRFVLDTLKYNFGGLVAEWKSIYGKRLKNNVQNQVEIEDNAEVYAGNSLRAIDPYNFIYDTSIHPTDLASEGEFFAEPRLYTKFQIQRMIDNEEIFNADSLLNSEHLSTRYYKQRPVIRTDIGTCNSQDYISLLGGADGDGSSSTGIELVKLYMWIPTKKYGIDKEPKMQICRIIIGSGDPIINLEVMNNAHGMLPCGVATPVDDGFLEQTKSYAENLVPFQTFSSAQMNIHQKANRKALYGLTFYNKSVINLSDEFDPVAGSVGVDAPPDADIGKAIHQIYDAPNTANTLRDIQDMDGLMQKILPTELQRQVAGLDRATQYQSAATVQSGNRRSLKLSRIIDEQALTNVREIQMFNIMQYQKSMEILSPEGDLIEIDPAEFRDTKIEFAISDGLKGLDKLSLTMSMKEVLNNILQSQYASQQLNVVEIINYITSMMGDKTDFSQFKFESEMDKLPPEQRDLAFQLLQAYTQQQEANGNQTPGAAPASQLPA